ncbi:MAG: ATP-binding protein [Alphaproteobacteria bacterium]|nr:ATP-binding protein [Alphaproteobacteria bacterium]
MFSLATPPPPANMIYYLFALLVVVYTQGYVFLRFAHATVIGWLAVAGYISVVFLVNPSVNGDAIYQGAFLIIMTLVVTFSHYNQEIHVRRDFRRNHSLRASLQKQEMLAKRAEVANSAKTQFVAMMSHELRTPLNAIVGFSEMMKDELLGTIGNEQYKAYSADIHSSGSHLLLIINDILDITKIEAGNSKLQNDLIDLQEIVDSAIGIISGWPQSDGLVISVESEDHPPDLRADARAVKQILLNLLSNAVKFTEQGAITVKIATAADGTVLLAVSDTGIGIAKEEIEKLARPFYQVDNSLARKFEGTGLGLALSKSLMELHDGQLTIESTEGAGTTVTCRFPSERVEEESTILEVLAANDRSPDRVQDISLVR